MDLSNKAFVITGASGGLGKVVSKELADAGAFLLLQGRNKDKLDDILKIDRDRIKVFENDFQKNNLVYFFSWLKTYLNAFERTGIELYGLFNAIGIPARLSGLNYEEIEDVKKESFLINYEIPRQITEYFIKNLKGNTSNILFMSSQYTNTKTPGKESYYIPKQKLEDYAFHIHNEYPNLIVNTILAGNLGIGMSSEARKSYEENGTLVDQDIIVKACLGLLFNRRSNGKKLSIIASHGKTSIESLV